MTQTRNSGPSDVNSLGTYFYIDTQLGKAPKKKGKRPKDENAFHGRIIQRPNAWPTESKK